ncbi:MAG: ATP-binding protein [Steroidobacteraceae bacterium]
MTKSLGPLTAAATRLTALYLLVFAAGVSLLLGASYLLTRHELELETDQLIQADLEGLRNAFELGGLPELLGALQLRSDSWGRLGAVYLLTDASLERLGGNLTAWPFAERPADKWVEFEILARTERQGTVDHPVRAGIFELGNGYILLVGTDLNQQRRFFSSFRAAIFWGIGLTTLLAAGIGYGYARRLRARVNRVAQACESIIAGDLARRLPVYSTANEFDHLSQAVNRMLDRLEQQSGTLRVTFDSTAHDLRAPLHRVRMRLEQALADTSPSTALRDAMQATLVDVERVQRTLTTLMQIAQADSSSVQVESAPVDLNVLVRELVELYEPEGREKQLQISMRSDERGLRIRGNRQLLAQLVVNLLENALKYVPAGGRITLAVTRADGTIHLEVADDGPGIPEADRERVLQPFERLERDATQPGSGLGLSLAAAIARLHGGRLVLEDNAPGLRAVCDLPAIG